MTENSTLVVFFIYFRRTKLSDSLIPDLLMSFCSSLLRFWSFISRNSQPIKSLRFKEVKAAESFINLLCFCSKAAPPSGPGSSWSKRTRASTEASSSVWGQMGRYRDVPQAGFKRRGKYKYASRNWLYYFCHLQDYALNSDQTLVKCLIDFLLRNVYLLSSLRQTLSAASGMLAPWTFFSREAVSSPSSSLSSSWFRLNCRPGNAPPLRMDKTWTAEIWDVLLKSCFCLN